MKIFAIVFLTTFFVSCNPQCSDHCNKPTKQSTANEVRNKTLAQLEKEKDLSPLGTGSKMMNQIEELTLCFLYYQEIDLIQARELLMLAGKAFLSNINADEKIRPFLVNYPFKPENIEIVIYLQKPNGKEPELGKLTVISMDNGLLKYDTRNPETERLTTIYKETFEEAEAKLFLAVNN